MQPSRRVDPAAERLNTRETESIKVVIMGLHGSGKSSLIRALAEDPISVERLGSSVSLDFGCVVFDRHEINIFGTPGRKEFLFMRRILGHGADACILAVDSTDADSLAEVYETYESLRSEGVPLVIAANKQDLEGAMTPEELRVFLHVGEGIVATSAITGEGLDQLIRTITEVIKESEKRDSSYREA